MAYQAVTCPQCGAAISYVPDRGAFFCQYCGAKIEKEQLNINISGNVTVTGIAGEQSLLERAFLFLEDADYDSADKYFERVLDANPKCARAYMGKLLVQKRYRSVSEMVSGYQRPVERCAFFQKALRFAKGEEYDELTAVKEANLAQYAQRLRSAQDQIDRAVAEAAAFDEYVAAHRQPRGRQLAIRAVAILSMIFAVIYVLFGFMCVFTGDKDGWIFVVLFSPPLIGLSLWTRSLRRTRLEEEGLRQKQWQLAEAVELARQEKLRIEEMWHTDD
ncbi:MAG: zinc ribbon domain-containing protein [Eubacterium sp.]|nr:zinc ribbon domain-containing protein [Eubacterium sp.]